MDTNFINLDDIKYIKTLSECNNYGLIHLGEIKINGCMNKCIIKILSIQNMNYYLRSGDKYVINGIESKLPKEVIINKYYNRKNDNLPYYLHSHFKNKHSIHYDNFKSEVDTMLEISKLNITPNIFKYGITDIINGFQYGIIVMEKMDISLKNYLNIYKNIKPKYVNDIKNTIKILHDNNWYHGDLQFSNICLNIIDSIVVECKLIDFYHTTKMNEDNKNNLKKQDLRKIIKLMDEKEIKKKERKKK